MNEGFWYLIIGGVSSLYIIFPILGKKRNSIDMSVFLLSIGYAGYSVSKKKEINPLTISRERYLDKSLKLQVTIGITNIVYMIGCYSLEVNVYVMLLLMGALNTIATFAIWKNLKRYAIK